MEDSSEHESRGAPHLPFSRLHEQVEESDEVEDEIEDEIENDIDDDERKYMENFGRDECIIVDFNSIFIDNNDDTDDVVFPTKCFRVKRIGKYMHGDKIGEGSYSKVKEAIDETTLQRRAMKIMTRQRLKKIPRGEANARRELAVLKKLNHKNCVKLIDSIYVHHKEKMYLILDFCLTNLQELSECGTGGKFPDWQTHKYFRQVLAGIEYLHSSRIVHNDIKPGNLLINTQQVIKICDFGVSQILDTYTDSDLVPIVEGTPAFAPPEVANGEESVHGFKVDMWAAGISLFKFVLGFYPYEGDNVYLIYEEIIARDPHIDEERVESELLRDLLKGLLKRNPDERFSTSDALKHAWIVLPNHPDPDRLLQEEVKINVKISKVTSLLSIIHLLHSPPEDDGPTNDTNNNGSVIIQQRREHEREEEELNLPVDIRLYRDFWRFAKRQDNDPRIRLRYRSLDKPCVQIEPTNTFLSPEPSSRKDRSVSPNSKTNCNQS